MSIATQSSVRQRPALRGLAKSGSTALPPLERQPAFLHDGALLSHFWLSLRYHRINQRCLKSMSKLCVSKEFNRFAFREEAPIADWLRALARDAHRSCGGPGVGAIGMCFSGGFALAMMADESVIAPVLSQPSMPFMLRNLCTTW